MDGKFGNLTRGYERGGRGVWEKRLEKEGETERPRKLKTGKIKGYPPQIVLKKKLKMNEAPAHTAQPATSSTLAFTVSGMRSVRLHS